MKKFKRKKTFPIKLSLYPAVNIRLKEIWILFFFQLHLYLLLLFLSLFLLPSARSVSLTFYLLLTHTFCPYPMFTTHCNKVYVVYISLFSFIHSPKTSNNFFYRYMKEIENRTKILQNGLVF